MRKLGGLLLAFAVMLVAAVSNPASAQVPIRLAGGEKARINVAILGDGFTQAEMGAFAIEAQNMADSLLNQEPWKSYKDLINIYRVDVVSADSGITTIVGGVTQQTRNSPLGAVLGCFNVDRLLCGDDTKTSAAMASVGLQVSRFQLKLVIGNSTIYGGGGGATTAVTRNALAKQVVLHEIGHSFANLTDEYVDTAICAANTYGPPSGQPNGTAATTKAGAPWSVWIDAATPIPTVSSADDLPGLYQGGHYCDQYFRPTNNSMMRSLGRPYEKVNTEALIRRMYAVGGGAIDAVSPAWTSLTVNPSENLHFAALPKRINGAALPMVWRINGAATAGFGTGGRELVVAAAALNTGVNTITVSANDPTTQVRNDPQGSMSFQRTWTVTVDANHGRGNALAIATLPSVRSVLNNATATAYATVINTLSTPLSNCKLQLNASAAPGLTMSFARTNPATNAVTGATNATFSMAASEVATFVFTAQATSAGSRNFPVEAVCGNVSVSPINSANQFTLATSASTAPDIIATSATPVTPGIVDLPANQGASFFAVAAVNIGAAASIDVRPVTVGEQLPVGLTVCESNPSTGACLATPTPALRVSFANNQTRTFSIFAVATAPVGFEPAEFRAALEMRDASGSLLGTLRGSTGVALRTTF